MLAYILYSLPIRLSAMAANAGLPAAARAAIEERWVFTVQSWHTAG